jgi:hypothetical protein
LEFGSRFMQIAEEIEELGREEVEGIDGKAEGNMRS